MQTDWSQSLSYKLLTLFLVLRRLCDMFLLVKAFKLGEFSRELFQKGDSCISPTLLPLFNKIPNFSNGLSSLRIGLLFSDWFERFQSKIPKRLKFLTSCGPQEAGWDGMGPSVWSSKHAMFIWLVVDFSVKRMVGKYSYNVISSVRFCQWQWQHVGKLCFLLTTKCGVLQKFFHRSRNPP